MDKLLNDAARPWCWAGNYAGYSVSISGGYAIVGAHGNREIWIRLDFLKDEEIRNK